ncbi:unnamed protein product [Vitrella brassicaformis CCMP3155]|uniref:Uncharacterized protein n=1 Tax=Vitrella brassicaformis (strain CCMP3155) TaxID=1169540 RepID=A0A0G4EN08_VITBC|nr:unnamed protein product [Vitrella brassicaformis CCMP3155]|eukprot:CEL98407.1 unnamed protein product [Vitrella brassicaformis CCMP3155]
MPSFPSVQEHSPTPVPQSSTLPSAPPGFVQPAPYAIGQPLAMAADPTYTQMVQGGAGGPVVQQPYVQPQPFGGAHVIHVVEVQDRAEESMLTCAKISCVLSIFSPIIGCIAFCVNLDAKRGTERYRWARYCLMTAFAVIALVIILRLIVLSVWLGEV